MGLRLTEADAVVAAGRACADERGVPSAIAIVDAGGNLLAFSADERSMLAARDLAINKAFTALALRRATADLGSSVLPGHEFFGLNTALHGRPLVVFAGGVPLVDPGTGEVVGAVGVSGGALEDDTAISGAAADALPGSRGRA